jgi:poly(hydroxyalkanoate) granule-associated protein
MASKAKEATKKVAEDVSSTRAYGAVKTVMLASVGAVALAKEEIQCLVKKLVERGEIAEQDGRQRASEVMEKRKKAAQKTEDQMDKQVTEILERLNVPSKADINALSGKITALTKKVDELKKA